MQKGLSGEGGHPKGRITTTNPGILLGFSTSGDGVAVNRRLWAGYGPGRHDSWRRAPQESGDEEGGRHSKDAIRIGQKRFFVQDMTENALRKFRARSALSIRGLVVASFRPASVALPDA